ncbi:MAG: ABC transporter ATP-binding protein [Acidobacteria bacterium]|nr:ABC transporter ATP-binding protein [Acidobacteriota bacterium]
MSCPEPRPRAELPALLAFVQPHASRLALVIALSLAGTALSLVLPYISKTLVDEALLGRNFAALVRTVALFSALTVASYGLNVWSGLHYTRVSAEILFQMRLAVFRHLQQLSPRFWARTKLGEVLSRLNNDIGEIQRVAAETALAWAGNALFLAGSVALMALLDWRLMLCSLAIVPPSVLALTRYRRQLEERAGGVRQASADIGSFLIETLTGVRLIAASNAVEREAARFQEKNDRFVAALMSLQRVSYLAGGLPGLLLSVGTACVFLYGGWLVIQGAITMGTLVAFLAYHMRLLSPVQALMGLWANFATARVSLRRVGELHNEPIEVREAPGAPLLASVGGEIEFDSVCFGFDRGAPVLEDVCFRVHQGEIVAIVGPSGSGKSTIADLLVRLLDPDSGCIRLDGHDLRALRLADIRRHIALVDQEPFLFHTSIAENIRYALPGATPAEIGQAARAAGLDGFLASLPEGLETIAGERGTALSAGEKQRIALARAFLTNPAVLVLDEPTSALDPATERQVMESYEQTRRTVLVITHREELARRAHRVLRLEQSRVVVA